MRHARFQKSMYRVKLGQQGIYKMPMKEESIKKINNQLKDGVVLRNKTRSFSAGEKLRILNDYDNCRSKSDVGSLLRREAIYSSHIASWRKQLNNSLSPGKPGPKANKNKHIEIKGLKQTNLRLERELDIARKLLELQKKILELQDMHQPAREACL